MDSRTQPHNRRGYARRFALALAPCFALCFLYLFFNPMETIASNYQFVLCAPRDALLPVGGLCLAATLAAAALLAIFRGRWFDWLSWLLGLFALCCYVQYLFLNGDMGVLNGMAAASLSQSAGSVALNLAVWVGVAALGVLAFLKLKALRTKMTLLVCAAMLVMQLSGLIPTLISVSDVDSSQLNMALQTEDEFVLSDRENIVVISLDAVSNDLLDEVVRQYPDALDAFGDFTRYTNCNTHCWGTFPGLLYMLTAEPYDVSIPLDEYFDRAWSSSRVEAFYEQLHQRDYQVRLYVSETHVGADAQRLQGKIDNYAPRDSALSVTAKQVKSFLKLGLYKYMPLALKARFEVYSDDLACRASGVASQKHADGSFMAALQAQGLTVQSGSNRMVYYHLNGGHTPFDVDASGQTIQDPSADTSRFDLANAAPALRGYLRMAETYLAQMKALGIYDNATIVLTADHGDYLDIGDSQIILFIKRPHEQHDALALNAAPVDQADFLATLATCIGGDASAIGTPVFDWSEADVRTRTMHNYGYDAAYPDSVTPSGRPGKHNILKAYAYTGDGDLVQQLYKDDAYTDILPMAYSLY